MVRQFLCLHNKPSVFGCQEQMVSIIVFFQFGNECKLFSVLPNFQIVVMSYMWSREKAKIEVEYIPTSVTAWKKSRRITCSHKPDHEMKNRVPITQIRYRHSKWSEWRDLNPWPLGPEPSALPNWATPRTTEDIIHHPPSFVKDYFPLLFSRPGI